MPTATPTRPADLGSGATSGAEPVRRALVSTYDKTGVVELCAVLHDHGVELVSTGSTGRHLAEAGLPVTAVEDVTGFPETLGGRVKTLHPRIHAALLADLDDPEHVADLDRHGIAPIDLVVGNLYPFADAVRRGAPEAEAIELIDIGGPTMLRAAAKNHAHVAVVCRAEDHGALIEALRTTGGTTADLRRRLAATAFAHVAAYDAAIAAWMQRDEPRPEQWTPSLRRVQTLRYGENPHQDAAFYVDAGAPPTLLGGARQLHGKELSYNNLLDTGAAIAMAADLDEPGIAIVKHANPAGLAVAGSLAEAYPRALAGDPVSAFGGIVAANRPLDRATAERIVEVFTEVVAAPGFDDDALEVLRTKRNLRILEVADLTTATPGHELRSVPGGVLVQDADVTPEAYDTWRVATTAQPDEATLADLRFAWTAAKHVRSNAIVLVRDRAVVGVGAGQMSRVDAVRLAVEKSDGRHDGAVLASDAFFPFRDGPDAAAAAGVRAIVQPGGSVRDDEVVAAADEHGVVMVLTGRRHFRH